MIFKISSKYTTFPRTQYYQVRTYQFVSTCREKAFISINRHYSISRIAISKPWTCLSPAIVSTKHTNIISWSALQGIYQISTKGNAVITHIDFQPRTVQLAAMSTYICLLELRTLCHKCVTQDNEFRTIDMSIINYHEHDWCKKNKILQANVLFLYG